MQYGIDIVQSADFRTVTLSQRNSILDVLERADMLDCNPAQTPCVAGQVWTKEDCPEVISRAHPDMPNFGGVVAHVLFISVWTIPKIAFVVNKLCKYMSNPGDKHVAALKRLLRYLTGIKDHGLVYTGSADSRGLVGFSDSSHMDCPDTSRSTVAFVFFFNNCVVSWFSKLHGFVTTCTNHSEYAALFMASKEAFHLIAWLRPLEEFLKLRLEPTPIYLDNDGAKALSKDPVGRNKNKHVRMSHHYTQELVVEGVIVTLEVDTSENCADVLTKALGPNVFQVHADKLASDTTKAIPAPTNARVMMIRGVERSVPAQASVVAQVGRAVSAAVEFSKVINKLSDVLAAQSRRVKEAEGILLDNVLEIAQQRAATYIQDVGAPMDLPDGDDTIARVNAQVHLAVAAAVDFSTDMASVSEALLA